MAIQYTRQQILDNIIQASQNMTLFYKRDFVNYSGKTSDTKEYYTEVVAEWLLGNLNFLNQIQMKSRTASYQASSHKGTTQRESSNRTEERLAMEMFRNGELPVLGKVIDYQTPLKDIQKDNTGKIDLLTFDGSVLRLLELKAPKSRETMLRCVLEGYTYFKTVDAVKLLKDFKLPANTKIQTCPLVRFEGFQHNEMKEGRPSLTKLMKTLDCKPFYYQEKVVHLIHTK